MALEDVISRLTSFIGKLSGVRWFIIVNRKDKTIESRSPIISDEDAYQLKDLIVSAGEVSDAISKYSLFRRRETQTRTLYIRFNGEGLAVESLGEYVVAINTDEKLVPVLSKIFDFLRKGESIKCGRCGHELLLETYTCPRCGRTVPFIVNRCPHCGYNLRVKKCPKCGSYVDSKGKPVKRDIGILATGAMIGVLILLLGLYMGATVSGEYSYLFYGIGGGMGAIMGLLGYILSSPH